MTKILLVDDHAIVRNGALEAIKLMGWLPAMYTHVVQADSVESALTITPEKHATLITFDEQERYLGFEIARQWRVKGLCHKKWMVLEKCRFAFRNLKN